MVCNKQINIFGHCEIWSHFTRSLYFHSPSARENADTTPEITHKKHVALDKEACIE